jgi:hypothetical protein
MRPCLREVHDHRLRVGGDLNPVVDELGALQCLYTPAGDQDDSDLHRARLLAARGGTPSSVAEAQARATRTFVTTSGRSPPRTWPGCAPPTTARVCARMADHTPDLHLGRVQDGAWIAWLTTTDTLTAWRERVARSELVGTHRDEFGDFELGRLRVQFEEAVDDLSVRLTGE